MNYFTECLLRCTNHSIYVWSRGLVSNNPETARWIPRNRWQPLELRPATSSIAGSTHRARVLLNVFLSYPLVARHTISARQVNDWAMQQPEPKPTEVPGSRPSFRGGGPWRSGVVQQPGPQRSN